MRLRNVKNADIIVNNSKYVIKEPIMYQNRYNTLFKNNNPIHLEIGMGKGNFIISLAQKYPNINFIGIEMYESVLVRAIQKLEELDLHNILLINDNANNIDKIFYHEIDTLYLNFSDPWPKKRHSKRRLTSPIFLEKYDKIFVRSPHIKQKTDNISLFAYSIETLSNHGYVFDKISLDLEHDDIDNVLTEYESKFMNQGIKINYLDSYKK